MKDILLLAAVSLLMSIGATLPAHGERIAHISLPEITITAKHPALKIPDHTGPESSVFVAGKALPMRGAFP